MIEEIKQKILKKVNEKLDGNPSIEELHTLNKILSDMENDPAKLYREVADAFRKSLEDLPSSPFLGAGLSR